MSAVVRPFRGPRSGFVVGYDGSQPFRSTPQRSRDQQGDKFLEVSGFSASHLWVGGSIDAAYAGNLDLEPVGSAVELRPALGLRTNVISTRMMPFGLADGTAWRSPNTSFADFTGSSWAFFVCWRSASPGNSLNGIIGKRASAAPNVGWEFYVGTGGAQVSARLDDDPTNYDSNLAGSYNDGQWHVFAVVADALTPRWFVASELAAGSVATLPASASNAVRWSIGTNRLATSGQEVAVVAYCFGAQIDGVAPATVVSACAALHAYLVEDLGIGAKLVLDSNYAIVTADGVPVYA